MTDNTYTDPAIEWKPPQWSSPSLVPLEFTEAQKQRVQAARCAAELLTTSSSRGAFQAPSKEPAAADAVIALAEWIMDGTVSLPEVETIGPSLQDYSDAVTRSVLTGLVDRDTSRNDEADGS